MPAPAVLALLAPLACTAAAPTADENPVELGRVAWQRDLDAALAESRKTEKPVFALFQEIPGCATCKTFGGGPLSQPLLVEAIEEAFVPLAIYNNRGGEDARVLKRFGEPSWNNPVVRFLDAEGDDLIERRDRVWSTRGIAERSALALRAAERPVPAWLEGLAQEAADTRLAEATYAMACYWSGEAALGSLDGLVTTEAGWIGGREVVEVRFDARRISRAELDAAASRASCSAVKGDPRAAKDSDRKYYLRRSPLVHLPLTPMQRTKVNAALGRRTDPKRWLSPRQLALLADVERYLAEAPKGLRDLDSPESLAELAGYEARLRERLASR